MRLTTQNQKTNQHGPLMVTVRLRRESDGYAVTAIADWTATVLGVWVGFVVALVTLSVLVGLIIGRV